MKKTDQIEHYDQVKDIAAFSKEGPQPQVIWETTRLKALVAGLEPGQQIPVHPEALGMYYFLEGTGWMTVDDKRFPVAAGTVIFAAQGAARGVQAESRLTFLAARVDEG